MTNYYVDTCIWLNLFKKEKKVWQIAKQFFEKVIFSEDKILYSGFILKELKYIIDNDIIYQDKLKFIKKEETFKFIKANKKDYDFARFLEKKFNYEISFFDCIHIAISKKLNAILVTRDKLLIKKAQYYILVKTPEKILF